MTSAAAFTTGAVFPLSVVLLFPSQILIYTVTITTLIFLAVLGAFGAKAGGANIGKAIVRVTFWGAVAMAVTAGVGTLFRVVI
jgi:VIT1/CCC1 family predicted Fe2+/Mn2+ transporter